MIQIDLNIVMNTKWRWTVRRDWLCFGGTLNELKRDRNRILHSYPDIMLMIQFIREINTLIETIDSSNFPRCKYWLKIISFSIYWFVRTERHTHIFFVVVEDDEQWMRKWVYQSHMLRLTKKKQAFLHIYIF